MANIQPDQVRLDLPRRIRVPQDPRTLAAKRTTFWKASPIMEAKPPVNPKGDSPMKPGSHSRTRWPWSASAAASSVRNWTSSREDMIVDAVYEAYEGRGHRGSGPADRSRLCRCSPIRARAAARWADALKLYGKPITMLMGLLPDRHRTLSDVAYSRSLRGLYDTVLVLGFDKPKDRGVSGPSVNFGQGTWDCLRRRPVGFLSARRATSIPTEQAAKDLAKIAVKKPPQWKPWLRSRC